MKIAVARLVLILFIILVVGSAIAQTISRTDAVETKDSGTINWTTGEVYATGIGAPPARPMNAAQARAMAERAAFVVALRNLLETVKGVRVDSETVVENFMTRSDVIRTHVEGIVKGARIVQPKYLSDGSVETLLSMPMKGAFMNAVLPETFGGSTGSVMVKPAPVLPRPADKKPTPPAEPTKPSPEKKAEPPRPEPTKPEPRPVTPSPAPSQPTVAFKGGTATGLVIDGRGLGLRPALLPKIVDPQGQEIYVGQVVTRTNAVEQGVAGYAKDVNAAANNFRVTDNPVVFKGISAAGTAKTDVMLGQGDAQSLRQLSGRGDFLQYCRVIIVY
jgi:hypothetical protein